jgi:GH15 family glucan-1,4-alpha-glucosidase
VTVGSDWFPGRGVREQPHLPIEDYGVIGDGRCVALIGRDGSVDWWCLPDMDSPAVFGAVLDARRGGRFRLAPDAPYRVERRYAAATNVLESIFRTRAGAVRVTDALTLPGTGLTPARELVRHVEGLTGTVPMVWSVEPRFGYGAWRTTVAVRGSVPVATARGDAVAVRAWDAGVRECVGSAIGGRFEARGTTEATIAVAAAHGEPLLLPTRDQVAARLEATKGVWSTWAGARLYTGPWRDAVVRSALALKLLVHAPSGAVAAAATTSLPEVIGGERNWDYRFCWVRDSAFVLKVLLELGCSREADAFFWWLMHASQLTRPRLQVLYCLDGGAHAPERTLDLAGYQGSTPVRIGNRAVEQLQLDVYGDLMHTAWIYATAGRGIDRDIARRLTGIAELVSRRWREPDAGIWEVRDAPRHFTHSKMMCWVALDRACRLAHAGYLPGDEASRWRHEANTIRAFIEQWCWSSSKRSYVRSPGVDDVDASVLLGILFDYAGPPERLVSTVDTVRRELADGPFVYRYRADDGLSGSEGAFLACSFWLAEALARTNRRDEAAELFESLLDVSNDLGLYAEEADPASGHFLGNFPQALTHLALISAAVTVARGEPV